MSVVLLFGEVVPQAVCSRYGLAVGAQSAWLMKVLMVLSWPVAAPLAAVLDRLLGGGDHAGAAGGAAGPPSALFRRAQLKALVDVHAADEGLGGNLTVDEVAVIRGALDLSAKTAACCLTPIDRIFSLPTDARLDAETLRAIVASGHSRVPVHSPGDKEAIVGVILVKELLLVDRDFEDEEEEREGEGEGGKEEGANRPRRRRRLPPLVAELKLRTLPHLRADTKLYDMLRLFETGRCHMAVLVTPPRSLGGGGASGGGSSEGSEGGDSEEEEGELDDFSDDGGDERRRRRGRRVPPRDFSDYAAASAEPPSAFSLMGLPSSALPVPSLPSNQSRSALAEVLCARGSRLTTPPSSLPTATAGANGGGGGGGEVEPAAAAAAAAPAGLPPPSTASSSTSSSSSVEDALGGRVLGVVTLEDVLEELIGHAILDETDRFEDRRGERRVNARALAATLPSHLRELLREHQIRVGGGGGFGGGEAAAAPAGYGVGNHHHHHLGDRSRGAAAAAALGGGSRLLPPAARQAVIGNISGTVPPHGNSSRGMGAETSPSPAPSHSPSPLAAAAAARRSRSRAGSSIDGGGSSPPSLLRQPLLFTKMMTTAAATVSPPPPPPAGKRWT